MRALASNGALAEPSISKLSASAAPQEHRLHTAESAAMHYAKRDAVPALAGTDAFSARAFASAYDKRAAKVRSSVAPRAGARAADDCVPHDVAAISGS